MFASQTPKQNYLLAALPGADWERFLPRLERVPVELGWALYESGGAQEYMYFPTTSIVSLLHVMHDGSSAEIAIVGNECVVGISLFMGGETTPSRAVVQSAGYAFRLKESVLKEEFERGGALQYLLLRYTQALITQMAQTAVCNRHHTIDQQLPNARCANVQSMNEFLSMLHFCRQVLAAISFFSGTALCMVACGSNNKDDYSKGWPLKATAF